LGIILSCFQSAKLPPHRRKSGISERKYSDEDSPHSRTFPKMSKVSMTRISSVFRYVLVWVIRMKWNDMQSIWKQLWPDRCRFAGHFLSNSHHPATSHVITDELTGHAVHINYNNPLIWLFLWTEAGGRWSVSDVPYINNGLIGTTRLRDNFEGENRVVWMILMGNRRTCNRCGRMTGWTRFQHYEVGLDHRDLGFVLSVMPLPRTEKTFNHHA
jgi:hypothetical protein